MRPMLKGIAIQGGCLCGGLRYESQAPPLNAGYCHCRLCQRSSGAPVLAWVSFPADRFAYRTGEPKIFDSSPRGHREFCGTCGSQIAYRDAEPAQTVDVNLATLDAPESVKPRCHIWTDGRIPWFDTLDELPRYAEGEPD
jgi:hypothetical protein